MAETQNAPATVEINDAIFCTHYLEVVRSDFSPSHNFLSEYLSPLLTVYRLFLRWKRREWFVLWGGFPPSKHVDDGGSADEPILFTSSTFLSLNSSIVRGLHVLFRHRIRRGYISARSMGLPVCREHFSPPPSLFSNLWYAKKFVACNQCYGWKKQITRARAQAKKASRKWTSWSKAKIDCNGPLLYLYVTHTDCSTLNFVVETLPR